MRRFFYILACALALVASTTSCGGGSAKAVKVLQKVVKSNGAKKAAQTIGRRSGDDVARHISSKTVTCTTCAGYGQVEFVDDYDNYLYTGDCPDCDGKGTVTKYEFK